MLDLETSFQNDIVKLEIPLKSKVPLKSNSNCNVELYNCFFTELLLSMYLLPLIKSIKLNHEGKELHTAFALLDKAIVGQQLGVNHIN